MIMIVLSLFVYSLYILFDLVPLYINKQLKLFWVYSILLIIALSITILVGLEVKIPSPAEPLKRMVVAIWGLK